MGIIFKEWNGLVSARSAGKIAVGKQEIFENSLARD